MYSRNNKKLIPEDMLCAGTQGRGPCMVSCSGPARGSPPGRGLLGWAAWYLTCPVIVPSPYRGTPGDPWSAGREALGSRWAWSAGAFIAPCGSCPPSSQMSRGTRPGSSGKSEGSSEPQAGTGAGLPVNRSCGLSSHVTIPMRSSSPHPSSRPFPRFSPPLSCPTNGPILPCQWGEKGGPDDVGVLGTALVSLNCLVNRSVVKVVSEVGVAAEPGDSAPWFGTWGDLGSATGTMDGDAPQPWATYPDARIAHPITQ